MTCQICGAGLPERAMFCGECGSSATATLLSRQRQEPAMADTTIIQQLPPQPSVYSMPVQLTPDAAPAAPLDPASSGTALPVTAASQFLLQFSTGESVTVSGTGLVGRRPRANDDELVDHLVQIHDAGMSVSKNHLEFGQQDGEFWLADRNSGNGTVIRYPDDSAVRCEPGRRYVVPRGSRVEIADQFFLLA